MSFTSLLFLVVFLPVFMAIYAIVPGLNRKNIVLLLFSFLFYAFGGVQYLLLLLAESALVWGGGLLMAKKTDAPRTRKALFIGSLIVLIAILIAFKYTNFFMENAAGIFGFSYETLRIALPLGISFYTFKLISYLADCYTEKIRPERNFMNILLYAFTFHHVLQGPIIRYSDIRKDIYKRKLYLSNVADGFFRFCCGLAMKTLLADTCGQLASQLAPADAGIASVSTAAIWLSSICFSLQIYLDFQAYSGMAIGLGQMIGFRYEENFNYPYMAVSVKDFWRRWHISLSRFFRDYVYIPLGGNRVSPLRTTLNLLAVWLLTGFWHGADWNYILWGLYYFVLITIENFAGARRARKAAAVQVTAETLPVSEVLNETQSSAETIGEASTETATPAAASAKSEEAGVSPSEAEAVSNVLTEITAAGESLPVTEVFGDIVTEVSVDTVAEVSGDIVTEVSGDTVTEVSDDTTPVIETTAQTENAENTQEQQETAHKRSLLPMIGKIAAHLYTILVFNFGWVLFRFTDFTQLQTALLAMFGFGASRSGSTVMITLANNIFVLAVSVLASTSLFRWLGEVIEDQFEKRKISKHFYFAAKLCIALLLFLCSLFAISGNTYTPFLYNQF